MKTLDTSSKPLSRKAQLLIWEYYCRFAPSHKRLTVSKERIITGMAIRRALEDCLNEKDITTYEEIVKGTSSWNTFDDLHANIKIKR